MPELPEVETVARGVQKRVCGDRILETWFSSHPEPFKTSSALQAKGLGGRQILAVHRTGKHLVCELGPAGGGAVEQRGVPSSAQWIVHLGMTGDHARYAARFAYTRAVEPVEWARVAFCGSAPLWPAGVSRSEPSGGVQSRRRRASDDPVRGIRGALSRAEAGHQVRIAEPDAAHRGRQHLR